MWSSLAWSHCISASPARRSSLPSAPTSRGERFDPYAAKRVFLERLGGFWTLFRRGDAPGERKNGEPEPATATARPAESGSARWRAAEARPAAAAARPAEAGAARRRPAEPLTSP